MLQLSGFYLNVPQACLLAKKLGMFFEVFRFLDS